MQPSANEIAQRLSAAVAIARLAGDGTLELFQSQRLHVDFKRDRSPVTEADRNAESMLRDQILQHFPQDGVLGEEHGEVIGHNEYRWVLDPIDGTKSFICGVPLYGTMVGLEFAGEAVAGVIYFPALDEIIYASQGAGTWTSRHQHPVRRVRVAEKRDLSECAMMVTDGNAFAQRDAEAAFSRLQKATLMTRTWGDCYGYYLVATGRSDIMIDPRLSLWDAVAAKPIVEEAGGVFCDWEGRARTDSGDAVAANAWLMPQILKLLGSAT
jgi:histidinol phosphatase-like enzyme (inositol monophosphatase family)